MSRTRKHLTRLSLAIAAVALTANVSAAQGTTPAYKRDMPSRLVQRAKITEDSAAKIAQARMPSARIEAVELEQEHGKLQYSYDMKVAGKSGIEEVNVNAMDGRVIGVEHESAATVKKEGAAEKGEAKKP